MGQAFRARKRCRVRAAIDGVEPFRDIAIAKPAGNYLISSTKTRLADSTGIALNVLPFWNSY